MSRRDNLRSVTEIKQQNLWQLLGFILLVWILMFSHSFQANAASLVNGGVVSGSISTPQQKNTYTFTANVGENIQIRVADTEASNNLFSPAFNIYGPTGENLKYHAGPLVAYHFLEAPQSGTYSVVVRDGTQLGNGTGSYNIYFVRAPGANEGGALINGGVISGVIDRGDLDSYTFIANAGENIQIRVADTDNGTNSFSPKFNVYGPTGTDLISNSNQLVASHFLAIPQSGTYTVVVSDGTQSGAGTGPYNIYFTRAPGANEGGALINGGVISGAIERGDLDSFTFIANQGENIRIQVADTDTATNSFSPKFNVYGPTGTSLISNSNGLVANHFLEVPQSGTYTVVVSDGTQFGTGTGPYNIYFTRAPGANEGGALINGSVISDRIDLGDLDSYTFTASIGESIRIQVKDIGNCIPSAPVGQNEVIA